MFLQDKVLAPWLGELTDRFARLRNTRSGRSQLAPVRVTSSRNSEECLSTIDLDCEPKLVMAGN